MVTDKTRRRPAIEDRPQLQIPAPPPPDDPVWDRFYGEPDDDRLQGPRVERGVVVIQLG